MQQVQYRLNIDMLDAFTEYQREGSTLSTASFISYLNHGFSWKSQEDQSLDMINGLFKTCVLGLNVQSDYITKARQILPKVGQSDFYVRYKFNNCEIGGNIDFMGFGKAIVFKSVSRYDMPMMLHSNTNWLMRALSGKGLNTMNFIILSQGEVYLESYVPEVYNYGKIEDNVEMFIHFLETHKSEIVNKSIFA